MSQKDFRAVADVIASAKVYYTSPDQGRYEDPLDQARVCLNFVQRALARYFAEANPRFDLAIFNRACEPLDNLPSA